MAKPRISKLNQTIVGTWLMNNKTKLEHLMAKEIAQQVKKETGVEVRDALIRRWCTEFKIPFVLLDMGPGSGNRKGEAPPQEPKVSNEDLAALQARVSKLESTVQTLKVMSDAMTNSMAHWTDSQDRLVNNLVKRERVVEEHLMALRSVDEKQAKAIARVTRKTDAMFSALEMPTEPEEVVS